MWWISTDKISSPEKEEKNEAIKNTKGLKWREDPWNMTGNKGEQEQKAGNTYNSYYSS